MTLKEALEDLKIDFENLLFIPSGGSGGRTSEFEITPRDFLKFAKEDLHDKSPRGIVNSLSNSKRAIDCQIDAVLNSLGMDYSKLPKAAEPFVKYFNYTEDISYKLKIIQALNLAPTYIIAKARTLRHKLEHYYQNPQIDEVKESIDVADLFIRSIEGQLGNFFTEFYITDKPNLIEESEDFDNFKNGLSISYVRDTFYIIIYKMQGETRNRENQFEVTLNEPEFYGLVRLMNSKDDPFEITESVKLIIHLIGHSISLDKLKVEQH